jgi:transcriptional regulator GlxA family with amidase domain
MDERVRAAIAFMNANLDRKLSPNEIAESVRLSPTHLRRLFKTETGKSVTAFRKDLQLDRAKQLLETTFLSVKQVAATVGLTEVSHFARDFKKAYALTPSEYASLNRKVSNGE